MVDFREGDVIAFLQDLIVLASFIAVCYAPFHYLDRFASSDATAKARSAIQAGQAGVDIQPLDALLGILFGKRHFTTRCFTLSCVMSIIFTVLFLGASATYLNLPDYLEQREAKLRKAETFLNEANTKLLDLVDFLIPKMEQDRSPGWQQRLADMKKSKADLEETMKSPLAPPQKVLLWMLASLLVSTNFLCDYVALGNVSFPVN